MSAPQTNIETQKRWHRGPIVGMIVVVLIVLGMLFWQMMSVADEGTPADNGEGQIDGRTGAPEPGSATPDGDVPIPQDGDVPLDTPMAPMPETKTQP